MNTEEPGAPWTEIRTVDQIICEIRDRVQVKLPAFGLQPSRQHLQYVTMLIAWTVTASDDLWLQPGPIVEEEELAQDREAVAAYFAAECRQLQTVVALAQSHPWWQATVRDAIQAGVVMAPDVASGIRQLVVEIFQAPDGFPWRGVPTHEGLDDPSQH